MEARDPAGPIMAEAVAVTCLRHTVQGPATAPPGEKETVGHRLGANRRGSRTARGWYLVSQQWRAQQT
jgi:hypothetical protein